MPERARSTVPRRHVQIPLEHQEVDALWQRERVMLEFDSYTSTRPGRRSNETAAGQRT